MDTGSTRAPARGGARARDDGGPAAPDSVSELPARSLDDEHHAEELRQRYYGLLQELRVILPGVQVLVAFLLTAPFAARFEGLDTTGRGLFGSAMLASLLSVTCMLTPTTFHRVAPRTLRSVRLVWAIRVVAAGMVFLGAALLAALLCVSRFVFGAWPAALVTSILATTMATLWLAIPLVERYRSGADGADGRTA